MTDEKRKARRAAAAAPVSDAGTSRPCAVLYARYSDKKQNEMSVEDQLALCRSAAERAGFEVVGAYFDRASTGRTLLRSRPGVMQMKERIGRGDVGALFVEGIERIGRRAADVVTTAEWMEHRGVGLFSANAGLIDWKMIPFYAGVADVQSREIGEKTRRGQAGKTMRGQIAAGVAYGYKVVYSKDLNREIDPGQAIVVRRVFEEYSAGLSPRAIAAGLNKDGIPSPRGGLWNDSTIRGNAKKRDGMLRNEAYVGIITYGRKRFTRDPDTGNRISRPVDDEFVIHQERQELQIIDDDAWNKVQERLEATYKEYAKDEPDRRSLNGSHRAKYLLARLVTCDCCGAGYTIVGKDRYGCYGRKTRGPSTCNNSKTISRFKLEERILRRLRAGLLDPELSAHFQSEVERLLSEAADYSAQKDLRLESDLASVRKAIERLLDLLENDVSSDALVRRLKEKEQEAKRLEQAIATRDSNEDSPTVDRPADLDVTYQKLLQRLDTLLAKPEHVVAANELIGDLIDEIGVRPDENAKDGLAVEIRGDLSKIFTAGHEEQENAPEGDFSVLSQISVVAGAGFEPATFRL